jgi:type I restriction enzyme S subunit
MEKQTNIPTLRFPEFANEWQSKKVGTLTERISNPVDVKSDVLYNQIGIRSHGKGIFYKDAVTGQALGNKRVFWVKENTFIVNIVFAWEQAVAKTTEKEIGMIASHRFPMYSPIVTQSNLDYLLHFFLTRKGNSLLELASPGGAGRNKTLGQKEFENLKIIVPNVAEQTKIAAFLTSIDNKINQLKQKKARLEQYKKGVMEKIFSQELRFKDENGIVFPKWEKKKLGGCCEIAKSGGTPTSTKKEYYNGDIPFLSIKDMTKQGKYIGYTSNHLSQLGIDNSTSWIVPKNSIIYSMYASVGFVAINKLPIATSQAVLNLILKSGIDLEFMYYALIDIQKNIAQFITTGTQGNLNAQSVKGFEIHLPSLAEQTKIANFLSALDEKINHCQKQIEQTELWKKGLLQKMFC